MNLTTLFHYMDAEDRLSNPFETEGCRRFYKKIDDFIISPLFNKELLDAAKTDDLITEAMINERETAFKVGFRTAVSLFMSTPEE